MHGISSAETRRFSIFRSLWLVIPLLGSSAAEGTIGTGPKIDIDIIQVADDVLVRAEGWHDVGVAVPEILSPWMTTSVNCW